eukprot:PRCOL_00003490-RA
MPVQGTGASTARFRDKAQAALRDKAQFSSALDAKIDFSKVVARIDDVRVWVEAKLKDTLGVEDDVVEEMVMGLLQEGGKQGPDPKVMQVSLSGFLEKNAKRFMRDLWKYLKDVAEGKTAAAAPARGACRSSAGTGSAEDAARAAALAAARGHAANVGTAEQQRERQQRGGEHAGAGSQALDDEGGGGPREGKVGGERALALGVGVVDCSGAIIHRGLRA